ncbi:unnamed protein product, partial [Musa textilis]
MHKNVDFGLFHSASTFSTCLRYPRQWCHRPRQWCHRPRQWCHRPVSRVLGRCHRPAFGHRAVPPPSLLVLGSA